MIFFKIFYKYLKFIVIFASYLNIKCMCIPDDDNVSLADYEVVINSALYGNDFDEVNTIEEENETPQTDILFE